MNSLDHLLHTLENVQLVRRAVEEDAAYLFKNALTQETLYQSLLQKTRKDIHQRVGRAYEEEYAERLDDIADILVEHYSQSDDHAKTLEFAMRAGRAAVQRYALPEALMHFTRGLEAAHRLSQAGAALSYERGRIHEQLGNFENAEQDFVAAHDGAQRAGDAVLEWQSLLALGFLWSGRNYDQAGIYLNAAVERAQSLPDVRCRAQSLNRYGNWLINQGLTHEAIEAHRQALQIFRAKQDTVGLAETEDLLALAFFEFGDRFEAADHYARAVRHFEELGDWRGLSSSLVIQAMTHAPYEVEVVAFPVRPFAEQLAATDRAAALCRQIGWQAGESFARWSSGWLCVMNGKIDPALARTKQGLQLAQEIQHSQWMCAATICLGYIHLVSMNLPTALELLQEGMERAVQVGSRVLIGVSVPYIFSAHLLNKDVKQARRFLQRHGLYSMPMESVVDRMLYWAWGELMVAEGNAQGGLAVADELMQSAPGGRSEPIVGALKLKADAFARLGEMDQAELYFQQAARAAEHYGAHPPWWQSEAALANLYYSHGRLADARRAVERVRAITDEMTPSDPLLQESFRRGVEEGLPPVS